MRVNIAIVTSAFVGLVAAAPRNLDTRYHPRDFSDEDPAEHVASTKTSYSVSAYITTVLPTQSSTMNTTSQLTPSSLITITPIPTTSPTVPFENSTLCDRQVNFWNRIAEGIWQRQVWYRNAGPGHQVCNGTENRPWMTELLEDTLQEDKDNKAGPNDCPNFPAIFTDPLTGKSIECQAIGEDATHPDSEECRIQADFAESVRVKTRQG